MRLPASSRRRMGMTVIKAIGNDYHAAHVNVRCVTESTALANMQMINRCDNIDVLYGIVVLCFHGDGECRP